MSWIEKNVELVYVSLYFSSVVENESCDIYRWF